MSNDHEELSRLDPEDVILQMKRRIDDCEKCGLSPESLPKLLDLLKGDLDRIFASLPFQHGCASGFSVLSQIISDIPDLLFLQDCNMRYIWISNKRPFGIDALLTLGKTESDIFPPAEAERLRRIKEEVLRTGNRAQAEVHLAVNGIEHYFDSIYYPWRDESGSILGLAGCARDVTERKMTEIQMLKMTRAVESSPTAIVLTDLDGLIEYVNPSLLQSAGFSHASEMIGRSVFDFTSEDGRIKLQEEIVPALLSRGEWQGELPLQRTDGRSCIMQMICARVAEDSGRPAYFLANFYNITDRMQAEEALILDESRLEALLKLNQMDEASIKEITDYALQAGVKLTGSRIGYLAFLDEDENILFMNHWSRDSLPDRDPNQSNVIYHLIRPGLWEDALKRKEAVIVNDSLSVIKPSLDTDPSLNLTPAQGDILRHMSVPVMDMGRTVVVVGVGNKEVEYNEADIRQLTLLMGGMYKLIQRRRAEEELCRRDLLLRGVARATNYLLTTDPDAIRKALGILGVAAGADRIRILESREWREHRLSKKEPVQWLREPAKPFPGDVSWEQFLGWKDTLSRGNSIQGVTSKILDPGREILEKNGILSFLLLPVFIEGRFCAVICIDDCRSERRWMENEVAILQAAAGSIGDAILRRRTEEALRESERKLTTLMSNLPGMAYRGRNDLQRTMEFVSDGCLELTGHSSCDLLHNCVTSYADLIHPDDRDCVYREIQKAIEKSMPFQLTYRINESLGTKWVWEQGRGIFSASGELIALEGFIHDITERKLAEDILKRTQEELERRVAERTAWLLRVNMALHEEMIEHKETEKELRQAQQAADLASCSKSEFLAYMSHEIRTPMNSVIGLAGLLLETDLSAEQRDYVETIHSSGDALLGIINDVLDFSKIDEGKMKLEQQPFSICECIEHSLAMVAAKAAEKGLDMSCEISESVPMTIIGDSARVRQILVNLLSNAVKFTESGSISIRVRMADEPNMVHFSVADTGIGISPADMGKLFHSFSQVDASTSRKYGGTGLGLAISRRLVEQMEGKIWVESEPGRGSTFHFEIKTEEFSGDEIIASNLLAGKRIMALLGSEDCLMGLVDQSRRLGMQIHPVISATEAEELIHNRFDAAILDIDVPGAEVLFSDIARKLPTIILANPDRLCPGRITLTKPVSESGLRLAVKNALFPRNRGTGRPLDPINEPLDLTILLAEDDPVNRKVALLMLTKLGYRADVVSNGVEAVEALLHKHYDVVLMDVQMPQMDGLEATKTILEMNLADRPRIFAMTAYAMEGDRERCLDAGMDGYISKPVQLDELRSALQSLQIADPAEGLS